MSETNRASATNILAAVPYFAALDAATFERVARAALRREYAAGQTVFVEGEIGAGLFVVESGWLKAIKVSPAGRELVLRFVGPNQVFNEIGVLIDIPNKATVIALEPVVAWMIQPATFRALLDANPQLAKIIIARLARRTLQLVDLIEDLSLRSVEARLARWLIEESTGAQLQRHRWTTQAELAARLGTVPDVLSRALRGLVEENLIQVERHQIQILDRAGLETKARE